MAGIMKWCGVAGIFAQLLPAACARTEQLAGRDDSLGGGINAGSAGISAAGATSGGAAGRGGAEGAGRSGAGFTGKGGGGAAGTSAGGAAGTSTGGAAGTSEARPIAIDQIAFGGGKCLPRVLPEDTNGNPTCQLLVARAQAACSCDTPAQTPTAALVTAILQRMAASGECDNTSGSPPCADFCVCSVLPASGDDLTQCQTQTQPVPDTSGWCYVSEFHGAAEAALVADCPANSKQQLRVFGAAIPKPGDLDFLACESGRF